MLELWSELFFRSAVILGAGIFLAFWGRAAHRHGTIFLSFLLLASWPLLAACLPAIPILDPARGGSVTIQEVFAVQRGNVAAHRFVLSPLWLWIALAAVAFGPLAVAKLRLSRLVRRAVLCTDDDWADLLAEFSDRLNLNQAPALLIHPQEIMPMVVGLWRPRIFLPNECLSWPESRRRIVLLHELAHIVRRDLLTQHCARVFAAIWWFQPLAWISLRLLRRESERACDELVLENGVKPSDYAAELLAIARQKHSLAGGLAMARQTGLESRLKLILQPQRVRPVIFPIVASLCLAVLTLAASAVTLTPESESISPRGPIMKHTVFAGLLAAAGLSAATIGGSLYDPSGAAVPNAKALLYDPDTNSKFETTTAADGKFSFETLPPGQYILRVQSPGFATLFREFNVKADSKVDRGLTLALGKIHEQVNVAGEGKAAANAATASGPPRPLRVGGNVEQTNLITKVQPVYPVAAKAAGIQGAVTLETVISKEGVPLDIRVTSSPDDTLSQSAIEAVRQWRYKPTLLNGNPVEVVTEVLVNYTLMN